MKHKWSLPFLRGRRRASPKRRDKATDIFRAFVHRLEQMRTLSRAPAISGATISEKV
jgi:hypothetical protein